MDLVTQSTELYYGIALVLGILSFFTKSLFSKKSEPTHLSCLVDGGDFGLASVDQSKLKYLKRDYELVRDNLNMWDKLDNNAKIVSFLHYYKIVEYVLVNVAKNFTESTLRDLSLFNARKVLIAENLLDPEFEEVLEDMTEERNKYIHLIGFLINDDTIQKHIMDTKPYLEMFLISFRK